MLLDLPSDISLHIFQYLSLRDLCRIRLASHQVNSFFLAHEESIYHQAAIYHRFVQPQITLEDVAFVEGSLVAGIRDWMELCKRWTISERNWDGRGHVHEGGYQPASEDTVISFVVDEEQSNIIVHTRQSGLTVRAVEDNRLLWALGKEYVGTSRFDFSEAFLVFMAKHSGLEIWRRATDVDTNVPVLLSDGHAVPTPVRHPSVAAARDFQIQAAALVPVDTTSKRGHYVPHAYIDTSNDIGVVRLFRMKFPLLAYVGFSTPNHVTVVDVPSGDIVWQVPIGSGRILGMPPQFRFPSLNDRVSMDLDLSKEHLCVCMFSIIVLFRLPKHLASRNGASSETADQAQEPPDQLILGDMDTPAARQTNACLMKAVAVERAQSAASTSSTSVLPVLATPRGQDAFQKFEITPPSDTEQQANMQALVPVSGPRAQPGFVCARISPDGRHIAAATAFGLLYFAWDFARVESGMMFSDLTQYLLIDEPLRDICWDTQLRRLAIRTAWEDVFLVTLNKSYHALQPPTYGVDSLDMARFNIMQDASAMRLRDFSNHELVGWARGHGMPFNGMQMTRTTLWLVWDVKLLMQEVETREREASGKGTRDGGVDASGVGSVCFVDFTSGF